jgi:hypothetical protein
MSESLKRSGRLLDLFSMELGMIALKFKGGKK